MPTINGPHSVIIVAMLVATGAALAQPAAPAPVPAPADQDAWLGVWLRDAVDGGAQVIDVVAGGPAVEAGVRPGDVIVELAGESIGDQADLGRALARLGDGDRVSLVVLRAGETVERSVTVRARRPRVPRAAPVPLTVFTPEWSPGLQVTSITPALRRHYGAPEDVGVLVTRVEPGGLAERAGVRVGDVLLRIGERDVVAAPQIRGTLVSWPDRTPVEIRVVRQRTPVVLTVERDVAAHDAAATGLAAAAWRRAREQSLEREIELLERRLQDLRRQLEELQGRR